MSAMRVFVLGAQHSIWRWNKFLSVVAWSRGLYLWREPKINLWWYWRCVVSWQVLFQQREMRVSWRLCNISEIHLWLWTVWSLVVCSQSSFYVTRERKDDKNRQNTLFLCWKKRWSWYPTNNCYLMSFFNQTNMENKKCVWTTKYRKPLEMCGVQHVQMKSVSTFQPIERLVSTTAKSAKPAATFWIFLLRTKNRQLCCLAVMVHIVLQERRVAITKKKTHLHFWRNFSAISSKKIRTRTKKKTKLSKYGTNVSVSYWLMIWATYLCFKSLYSLSIYNQPLKFVQPTYRKSWSPQSPTMESSGLSILVPTLLLLQ